MAKLQGGSEDAASFKLGGLGHLPSLLAASWVEDGLLLVTNQGHLAGCPGQPPAAGGSWSCSTLKTINRLPVADGVRLAAAATGWLPDSVDSATMRLHAAIVEESAPEMASIFALEGTGEASYWVPLGEVVLPRSKVVSLSFMKGELLISTDAGHLIRRRVKDGVVLTSNVLAFSEPKEGDEQSWTAACGFQGESDGVAHLQLHRQAGRLAWRPEVLTLATESARRLNEELILQ